VARNKFADALANQAIRTLHFFDLQQMLSMQGEKREASTNLQRNNVARQVEGFCISYFAALRKAADVTGACQSRDC